MATGSSLAESAKTREAALAQVKDLEQATLEAMGKLEACEAQSKVYMQERDTARAELEAFKAKMKPAKAD